MSKDAAAQFARIIIETEPYHNDIVFVGGWVHALYLAEANERGAIYTDDVDITVPATLTMNNPPALLELAERAGFERDPISEMKGTGIMMVFHGKSGATVPIDFLTEGSPRIPILIGGQEGLVAQGYPGQQMLLENTREMLVGEDIHPLLNPARRIRVPTLGAYGLQKGISSSTRTNPNKRAKDLVYLYEIARHPNPGRTLRLELPLLRDRYADEYDKFRAVLTDVLRTSATLTDICEQLHLSGRAFGPIETTRAMVRAQFDRLLSDDEST